MGAHLTSRNGLDFILTAMRAVGIIQKRSIFLRQHHSIELVTLTGFEPVLLP